MPALIQHTLRRRSAAAQKVVFQITTVRLRTVDLSARSVGHSSSRRLGVETGGHLVLQVQAGRFAHKRFKPGDLFVKAQHLPTEAA